MTQPNDVLPGSSPAVPTEPVVVPPATPTVTPAPVTPGSQTPPEALLAAVQEERRINALKDTEIARLQEELKNAGSPSPTVPEGDVFSDEGKIIVDKYVKPLEATIRSLTEQSTLKELIATNPILQSKAQEFADFRKANPEYKLEHAVSVFVSQQGIAQPRKGLEDGRGGERTPTAPEGMTTEEIERLRTTDYRGYQKALMEGKIPLNG